MSAFSAQNLAPDTAVIHVGKALDFRTALIFRALCQEQLDHGVSLFILDFSSTGSLDATGLSGIFAIHRQAIALGGGVAFAALTRPVQRVLDETQARAFPRFSTVAEATSVLNTSFAPIGYTALFPMPQPPTAYVH